MKLTAQIKLVTTEAQTDTLKRTLEMTNAAANYISGEAWSNRVFSGVSLQKLVYNDVRSIFGLSAQSTCLVVRKVADAYKLDKKTKREFREIGSVGYDNRILRFDLNKMIVSIWTIEDRITIPFVCGDYQMSLLKGQRGETDLVYHNGNFYLMTTCDVDEKPMVAPESYLGVDLGVVNIATDSDGKVHSAKAVKNVRYRHRELRKKLQSKGTKATRKRLRKLSGKERRFATWVNHNISKGIVATAKDTGRGVALEDLTNIRERVTARKPQRATLHSWSFFQLRSFIEYKAKKEGVQVVAVDPRNTSRQCPCCGHIDKANRPSQSTFCCLSCGFSGHADTIAAVNISRRASVTTPYISDADLNFYQ